MKTSKSKITQTATLISYSDSIQEIKKLLKLHARGLGIPSGSADDFIDRSLTSAEKSLKKKTIITSADLTRAITKELKKYNRDLAYVYENCAIII